MTSAASHGVILKIMSILLILSKKCAPPPRQNAMK